MHPQNIRIRTLLLKISILHPIPRIRQRQSRRIRPKLLHRLSQSQRIPRTLTHLLPIQHQMPIRTHTEGEHLFRKERSVDVEVECQVVGNEIFGRGADVVRVKVGEFVFEGIGFVLGER